MMKYKFSFVFILSLCLILVACGQTNTSGEPDSANQGNGGTAEETDQGTSESGSIDYPTKDISAIVTWGASGGTDITARTFLSEAEELLPVSFRVSNVTGGAGAVGWGQVKESAADGYTLTVLTTDVLIHEATDGPVSRDDFIPLATMSRYPNLIAVPADSKWEDLDEFLEEARENPGQISVANGGLGSSNHLTAVLLEDDADVSFNHVPFNGGAESIAAALGGNVDAIIANTPELASRPDMKTLAVFSAEPSEDLPDAPIITDFGLSLEIGSFRTIAAPADTPEEIVQFLEETLQQTYHDTEFEKKAREQNLSPSYLNREETISFYEEFYAQLVDALELME